MPCLKPSSKNVSMPPKNNTSTQITVIIPSFNEQTHIKTCIESALWADEVLVVDSFSTDATVAIAARYPVRILEHEYKNPTDQKNWALKQARTEWVFFLDCDECLSEALRDEILALLASNPPHDGYEINRKNYLMGKHIKYAGWGNDRITRLLRREKAFFKPKRVHEKVVVPSVGRLNGWIDHQSVRSISHWADKINRYSSWKALDRFEGGMRYPVWHLLTRPILRFTKDTILRGGILEGWRGLLIAAMASYAELIMAAKVLELTFKKQQPPAMK